MANEYITLIQTFSIGDLKIIDAWDKLKKYRRKLYAVDKDAIGTYRDRALLLILIRTLPKQYTSTIDTLDAQPDLTVEEKLKRLQTKENRLASEDREDMALIGSHRNRGVKSSQFGNYLAEEGSDSGFAPICYICDERHFVKSCPYMKIARTAVQEHIHENKNQKKPKKRPIIPRSSSKSKSLLSRRKIDKSVDFKGKAYEACLRSNPEDESETSNEEEEEDNEENHEYAQISRALI
ncbi:hypothetical protein EPUL_002198, partial [Erysiphe pulchra]